MIDSVRASSCCGSYGCAASCNENSIKTAGIQCLGSWCPPSQLISLHVQMSRQQNVRPACTGIHGCTRACRALPSCSAFHARSYRLQQCDRPGDRVGRELTAVVH